MRLHTAIAALVVIGIGLGLAAPAHVSGTERVLTVCYWKCDFRRIQDAINAAFDDETVLIKSPGLYDEKLTITKSIKLVGDENALPIVLLFMEAFSGPLISIGEEEKPIKVTLKNLSLLGWPGQAGVVVKGPTILVLENVEVRRYSSDVGVGIYIYEQAQVTIKNSIFRENGPSAISSSGQVVVEDSQIFENGGGISIYENGQLHLIRSSVFNNILLGIYMDSTGNVLIEDSHIYNNRSTGVFLGGSSKVLIKNSHIYGNRTVGIGIGDSSNVELLRTTINHNGTHGIALGEQPKLVARESFIYQNGQWGLTAVLRKCGFNEDLYKGGTIDVDESNVIIQNRGGDICLP
jgi:parallel beta-helix repeat protein